MDPEPIDCHLTTLTGAHVRLEPLETSHVEGLVRAANEDRGSFGLTIVPSTFDEMSAYVASAMRDRDRGLAVPYATVRVSDDLVVGSTRFANAERWPWPPNHPQKRHESVPDAIEIGWTWLAPSAQRTPINTEAKHLMLALAFERWKVHRVTLKTDERNARSRANIERIGGKLDGILRAHMPASDGGVRNTAIYSIVASEWPVVAKRLDGFLAR